MSETIEQLSDRRSKMHHEALALLYVVEARLRHPEYATAANQAAALSRRLKALATLDAQIGNEIREYERRLLAEARQ